MPPPSLDVLLQLAEARNSAPLPEIKPRHGLKIPPESECLLAPNYQLRKETLEPLVKVESIDTDAVEDRKQGRVISNHTLNISAPSEDWKPGPDRDPEPWQS